MLQNRSLLGVNEDFEGKRNTEELCKRAKCKFICNFRRVQPRLRIPNLLFTHHHSFIFVIIDRIRGVGIQG